MNISQKNYAKNRIKEILKAKMDEIYAIQSQENSNYYAELDNNLNLKFKMIKEGKLKLKNKLVRGKNSCLLEAFEDPIEFSTSLPSSERYKKMIEKITTKANELIDSIILGNDREAKKAIKEMEKISVKF